MAVRAVCAPGAFWLARWRRGEQRASSVRGGGQGPGHPLAAGRHHPARPQGHLSIKIPTSGYPRRMRIEHIIEAAPEGVLRVRRATWPATSYMVLWVATGTDGRRCLGPWFWLFDRRTQEAIGEPTPQKATTIGWDWRYERGEYEVYAGPLDAERMVRAPPA